MGFILGKSSELVEKSRIIGWEKAIEEIYGNDLEKKEWIKSIHRGIGVLLTSVNENSKVLDAGCGWGTISFFLSKICKEVYCLDSNPDSINFIKTRAEQENVKNIYPVVGNVINLPFKKEKFDLVVLNGVLEYLPFEDKNADPLISQLRGLKKIREILKQNGEMYIGIENRFGFQYLLGRKDEHTGIRFITILPRKIANFYHNFLKKENYKPYTHSYLGMKNILHKAGFKVENIFFPIVNYRYPYRIFNLDDTYSYSFVFKFLNREMDSKLTLKRKVFKIISNLIILLRIYKLSFVRYFLPSSFIIIAKKNNL